MRGRETSYRAAFNPTQPALKAAQETSFAASLLVLQCCTTLNKMCVGSLFAIRQLAFVPLATNTHGCYRHFVPFWIIQAKKTYCHKIVLFC